ncbi:MAG: chromosome segregation protein SMC, partial [Acidobacteriota bacterium]|nr:chromosome segregation protein SMC [Acidobacteriota bacterium]
MSRLELDFSSGITAIIGPNGCGKSNVVDAIRWVLGEQRTRLLRNTKMENVLFNGTRLRKPLGLAEVSLTLSNEDHGLNLDYSEVSIGRRLHRDGTSEYLVNGQSGRLKDIRGLLVDTGLGNNAYSIIERDMIEKVLSEREEDKRHLLEEAAGVSRYRIQREEAERKIKATEQDLVRLNDILQELDKEIRSLRYQMAKARRYTKLKEDADLMETVLLKATLHELLRRKDELLAERREHANIRLADDNEIAIRENRLQEMRLETAEFERQLQTLHEKRYELSSTLQQHEERIAVHNERIASSRSRVTEDEEEVARALEKLAFQSDELARWRGELEERKTALTDLNETLAAREAVLRETSRRMDEAREKLRNGKQLVLDLLEEKAKEQGAMEHIERALTALAEKQDAIESRLDDLAAEEGARVEELARIEERAAAQQRVLADLRNDLTRLTENLDRVTTQSARCDVEYAAAHREHARLTEKRSFLERVKQEHTRWSDETIGRYQGLTGVLADFVRVEKRYRRCFEAALMPVLRSVVAASRGDAVEAVRGMRGGESGRVQILYADRFAGGAGATEGPGVIGRAVDLVDCDGDVAEYLEGYLDGVLVAEDVEAAIRLLDSGGASRVATLDGVFFDGPGRIIVAGSDDIEMTILEYESKLSELVSSLREAETDEERLRGRREQLTAERDAVQAEIAAIRTRLADEEPRHEELAAARRAAELHLVRVKEKITSLETAIAETRQSSRQLRDSLEASREREAAGAARAGAANPEELPGLEARVVELEREKEASGEAAAALRLQEVTVSGEVQTLETRIQNAERMTGELSALVQSRREDAERCREQIRLGGEDIEKLRGAIAELHEGKEAVEKEITGAGERYDVLKTDRDALEKEAREMKDQRDAKRENIERVSVELAALEERVSALLAKARENFDQDLAPYVADRSLFAPAEWEKFERAALEDLKQKLAAFGPVNMLAMEEFDEKKERFDFLGKQHADLVEAKDSLTQAIRRINREARRLLTETFALVRENFRQTFFTLFDGGEADLLWADSDDPLEANIRIVASPKGKKLHEISVLSSGERA